MCVLAAWDAILRASGCNNNFALPLYGCSGVHDGRGHVKLRDIIGFALTQNCWSLVRNGEGYINLLDGCVTPCREFPPFFPPFLLITSATATCIAATPHRGLLLRVASASAPCIVASPLLCVATCCVLPLPSLSVLSQVLPRVWRFRDLLLRTASASALCIVANPLACVAPCSIWPLPPLPVLSRASHILCDAPCCV